MAEQAREILNFMGLKISIPIVIIDYNFSTRQMIEIARIYLYHMLGIEHLYF